MFSLPSFAHAPSPFAAERDVFLCCCASGLPSHSGLNALAGVRHSLSLHFVTLSILLVFNNRITAEHVALFYSCVTILIT
jgi:hypothetical protein